MRGHFDKELDGWAKAIDLRGAYARRKSDDKPFVELDAARNFAEELRDCEERSIEQMMSNASDPPDVLGMENGVQITLEVTELVCHRQLKAKAKANTQSERNNALTKIGNDRFWSKEKFQDQVQTIIRNKHEKFLRQELWINVLLIVSDDIWLNPDQARMWSHQIDWEPSACFSKCYLMCRRQPTPIPITAHASCICKIW